MIHVVHNILVCIIIVRLFIMYAKTHLSFKLLRAGSIAGLTGLRHLF